MGGGGVGRGFKTSSRLPSSSATVMAWVRYLIGNIDYFFFLCLTLVTKRITPFFKYKLLVIFHHDVKFPTTLYFLFTSCRAWPVVRCCGNLALPHAGHRWWWRLRWFWGGLVNYVHTFLKTGFRALFHWVSKNLVIMATYQKKVDITRSQWELKATSSAGNVSDQDAIGFRFVSDWLRELRELCRPMTLRSKENQSHPC